VLLICEVFIKGININATIEPNMAITPPNLSGIDLRIA
jgi:hypothetical protein